MKHIHRHYTLTFPPSTFYLNDFTIYIFYIWCISQHTLLSFNFYTRVKSDLHTTSIVLQYYEFHYIFTCIVGFVPSYVFICYYSFVSTWWTTFSIACNADIVVINCLCFCLFGKILILPSCDDGQLCWVKYLWFADCF